MGTTALVSPDHNACLGPYLYLVRLYLHHIYIAYLGSTPMQWTRWYWLALQGRLPWTISVHITSWAILALTTQPVPVPCVG